MFLKGQKVLILVNMYKIFQRITNRRLKVLITRGPERLPKSVKGRDLNFKKALAAKKFPAAKEAVIKGSRRAKEGVFSLTKLELVYFKFNLERFLRKSLSFSVNIRLKNIFSLKKKTKLARKINSLLTLCRKVYKTSSRF